MGTDPAFLICTFSRKQEKWGPSPFTAGLGAFDDLELVVDAFHAVDLAGDLRGAATLLIGLDGAPEAYFAIGGGDVDPGCGELRRGRLERLFDLGGELLVRIGLGRLGLGPRLRRGGHRRARGRRW